MSHSVAAVLQKNLHWVFDGLLERSEPLRSDCSVQYSVVGGESDGHNLGCGDCAILEDHGLLPRSSHGEDSRLWRVDDRGELLGSEHAQVGNSERSEEHTSELQS